jgi:hypothetical protein
MADRRPPLLFINTNVDLYKSIQKLSALTISHYWSLLTFYPYLNKIV